MVLEKIQYSLIYRLYRGGMFKLSRAYNRTISIPVAALVAGILLAGPNFTISSGYVAITFAIMFAVTFGLLQKNVSRRKLFEYRRIYPGAIKYVRPFYIAFLSGMLVIAFFYIWNKMN